MNTPYDEDLVRRIHNDLRDDLDEELELEVEDRPVEALGLEAGDPALLSAERRQRQCDVERHPSGPVRHRPRRAVAGQERPGRAGDDVEDGGAVGGADHQVGARAAVHDLKDLELARGGGVGETKVDRAPEDEGLFCSNMRYLGYSFHLCMCAF